MVNLSSVLSSIFGTDNKKKLKEFSQLVKKVNELEEYYSTKDHKEILKEVYNPGKTDGSGNNRNNLRQAMQILKKANYKLDNKILKDPEGRQIKFEILLISPAFERIVGPFIKNLKKLGVEASIRIVDKIIHEVIVNVSKIGSTAGQIYKIRHLKNTKKDPIGSFYHINC